MFQSRVFASILKRNKGGSIINNAITNLRGTKITPFNHLRDIHHQQNPPSRSFLYGFKSLSKGHNCQYVPSSSRKMSTVAASVGSESKEGLRLLVNGGPKAQKLVGIWLFGSAAWVFSMVILGGVTRLTRSGLSMTDWKFTGGLPPLSNEDWLIEFEKYKQSPEYKIVNKGMNVEDFKFIYWMEYAHRMWGRGLGILKGYVTVRLGTKLCGLFALGAGQGLIGWWMVKSGLEEPASEYSQPRVSPYRLAAHLTSAFVIYSGLFWTALSVVMPEPPAESLAWVRGAAKVKSLALPASLIVGLPPCQEHLGMHLTLSQRWVIHGIPDDIFDLKPVIRNFFENTSTVQLDHRILAMTSLTSIGALWWFTRKLDIHPAVKSLIGATVGMAAL
ncbi:cytochrome oxidase assembly protein [Salix suchowensis]|nr:cytochrome oxidase assembly protein [Salix suchowensis]